MVELFGYLKEYKKDAVMTPIWVLLETVCEMLLTITIGRFIDELGNSGASMELIFEYGGRLLIIAVISLIFGALCGSRGVDAGDPERAGLPL